MGLVRVVYRSSEAFFFSFYFLNFPFFYLCGLVRSALTSTKAQKSRSDRRMSRDTLVWKFLVGGLSWQTRFEFHCYGYTALLQSLKCVVVLYSLLEVCGSVCSSFCPTYHNGHPINPAETGSCGCTLNPSSGVGRRLYGRGCGSDLKIPL